MKILYITGAVGVGGVESFLLNVSQMPRVESYFFLFQNGPLKDELEKRGARVFVARKKFRLRNPISWFLLSSEIAGLSRRLGISCIHSTMAYSALVGSFASKKANLPHIWFQHGPVSGWMDSVAGWLRHQGILCNSKYTMMEQSRFNRRGPFYILPLGTPDAEMEPFNSGSTLKLVMACRAHFGKGPHLFQEAIQRIASSAVEGTLFLAEGDSTYEKEIRRKGGLKILPSNPSISKVFSGNDVLVNASIYPEAFGLTVIEAMMRGIVPIAPRAWGPAEIIDDGVNGLLFEPGNVDDLVEKILMLQDENLRKKLRENSRKTAVEKYSLGSMFENLEKIYRTVHETTGNFSLSKD